MFAFAGKDSEEMGLMCTQYTLRHKAERGYTFDSIPGRAEPVFWVDDNMQPVLINVDCVVMDVSRLESIYAWLHNAGKGVLIDERHPDRYRTAIVCGKITPVQVNDEIAELSIPFLCSAFAYNVDNEPIEITASGTEVVNNGTVYSDPLFIITPVENSSGRFQFWCNTENRQQYMDINLQMAHSRHNIVLDADRQMVYYEDTKQMILHDTAYAIPKMDVGRNVIAWSDGAPIEKVTVIKNERFI